MKKTFKDHQNYYMLDGKVFKQAHESNGRKYRTLKLKKTYRTNGTKGYKIAGYYLDGKFYSLKRLNKIALCQTEDID